MAELAGWAPLRRSPIEEFEFHDRPDFEVMVERGLGIAKLQLVGRKQADNAFMQLIGAPAPAVGRQRELDGLTIAWLAPGEWLLIGGEATVAARALQLSQAGGSDALVVDLSHARTSFLLGGAAARDVLASHCPIDLWPERFPENAIARSLLGEAGLFIARLTDARDGQPVFRIIVDQTMGPYAVRMLAGPLPRTGAKI